jgi:hypothetical protein
LNSGEKNWKISRPNFKVYWFTSQFFPEFLFSKVSIPLYFEVFLSIISPGIPREGRGAGGANMIDHDQY